MKHLIGLYEPAAGEVVYSGVSFTDASPARRNEMLRSFGVLYQNGALWGSMTLAENVAFPLEEYTRLSRGEIAEVVQLKLALVGLRGFETYFPSEISGGMRKRAALARAIAMDPKILFFDEPSAGLDPVSSRRLDELILRIRDYFGTTVVIVTHELPSIFAVGDKAIYLDTEDRTVTAIGTPRALRDDPPNERVRRFMTRSG
jgi:phospholipid/cholesterol/gamma-HCH transport system ATP-binding protein